MFDFLRRRRRERARNAPFPEAWAELLEQRAPNYRRLPTAERSMLHGHMQVLLDEKHFEGCNGLDLTDEMRVTIAAHAAMLLLGQHFDYFPRLTSILVYPDTFVAEREVVDDVGLVFEGEEELEGESWDIGALVLSWRDVRRDCRRLSARNVVFHEFAHQLDQDGGDAGGWPEHLDPNLETEWMAVMAREYEALVQRAEAGKRSAIDPYGAESPAEFFAVITEAFLGMPGPLKKSHPDLYALLAAFYRQDPAARIEHGGGEEPRI